MQEKTKIDVEALKRGGVIQLKGKDMFSIWVKTFCCNLSSAQLRKVSDVAENYGRGIVLFTTRQIPIIPFIKLNDVDEVKKELAAVSLPLDRCGPRVRNINVCYDEKICSDAVTNSLDLGEKLEKYFSDPVLHKIKIGIAGCKKDCIISRVLNDICFIGIGKKRYDAYVGGRLGLNPFVGVKLAGSITEDECVKFVQNYFDFIKTRGKEGERAADLINRFGREKVRQELNKNLEEELPGEVIECESKIKEEQEDGKIILKIRATCGEVSSSQARKIAEISKKYGNGFIHFAVRGDPEIPCIDKENLGNIKKALREADLKIMDGGIDNIQTCFGDYCPNSACDTQTLLRKVEKKVEEMGINNPDIRISGAGCPNSCGIAHLSDIGFLGVVEPNVDVKKCNGCGICVVACKKRKAVKIENKIAVIDKDKCGYCGDCIRSCPVDAMLEKRKGFTVLAGGQAGENTKLGEVIAEFLSEEAAVEITGVILKILKEKNVSAADVINEMGIEKFKARVAGI